MSPQIFIARHAHSEANETGLAINKIEAPLTETGIKQAGRLGNTLKEAHVHISQVFVSSAVRTQQTAEIVINLLGLNISPMTDNRLNERFFWEEVAKQGLSRELLKYLSSGKFPENYVFPHNWETDNEVARRMLDCLSGIEVSYPYNTTLVISHCLSIEAILKQLKIQWRRFDYAEYRNFTELKQNAT